MHEDKTDTPDTGTKPAAEMRNKIGVGLLGAAFASLIVAIIVAKYQESRVQADPGNPEQVARGKVTYMQHCAACHGANLEGQPKWQEKLSTGRMPAPPHDASGHTWHHPDSVLFGITKHGLVPGKYAPPKYESDMPAFGGQLSDDDIWAVLAYFKSAWPADIRAAQTELTHSYQKR